MKDHELYSKQKGILVFGMFDMPEKKRLRLSIGMDTNMVPFMVHYIEPIG